MVTSFRRVFSIFKHSFKVSWQISPSVSMTSKQTFPLCSERVRDWSADIVFEHFKLHLFWQLMNKPKSIFRKCMRRWWLYPKLMFCTKYFDHDYSLHYNGKRSLIVFIHHRESEPKTQWILRWNSNFQASKCRKQDEKLIDDQSWLKTSFNWWQKFIDD